MNRVEYDLNSSSYCVQVHDYVYFFSSEFNLNRFNEGYNPYAINETNKLKAKYHVNIDIFDYFVLAYYKKIEKRGFKVLTYDSDSNGIIELKEDYLYTIR